MITITVREYAGACIASVVGNSRIKSSCTSSARTAAEKTAEKFFGTKKYFLQEIASKTYIASDSTRECPTCQGHGWVQGPTETHECETCRGRREGLA